MLEEAIIKLKEEMKKNKDYPFIVETGKYVLVQVETNKEAAKKIASGEKTIKKALEYLESEARKKAKKGDTCVIMSSNEGFAIISNYFEFENIQEELEVARVVIEPKIKEKKEKNNVIDVDFDVELEDLF